MALAVNLRGGIIQQLSSDDWRRGPGTRTKAAGSCRLLRFWMG